ncbi:MFS transporter [Janibacter indicus]|uniref:MFS transporter n=1 Tax=Janibacter indicus TaxID=857417 RepID=A0A1L3MKS2_9MICO|nr:MFS transporter [Janibacter indicus]
MHDIGRRRAYAIWGAGLAVYVLAVFHRTSLGVAGLLAADRFDINASQLATFTVLQLAVYAGMQVPVGVALDRFGSRILIISGLVCMTVGQLWFAVADSFAMGLGARALVGAGDAMVFTAVLRLVAVWFLVRQAPVITQVTGMIGQMGAVAAAVPLSAALHGMGWTRTYALAASLGVILLLGAFAVIKDSPYERGEVERIKLRALRHSLTEVWRDPGTRLGLSVHFTSQFAPTVFALLWGYPFLVSGQGLSPTTASTLLTMMTFVALVAGPTIGRWTGRNPYYRSVVALGVVGAIALVWAVVLALPGRAPLWLLVVLVAVTAVGGPGSMIAFDLARTFHRSDRLGRASGVVNMGGFVASLVTMALIGLVLDRLAPGGPSTYTLDDFRIAMSVQFLLWGFGAWMIWRYRRRSLDRVAQSPGAMDALRRGEALLPGISRDHEA